MRRAVDAEGDSSMWLTTSLCPVNVRSDNYWH